jgi:hypothetical protein
MAAAIVADRELRLVIPPELRLRWKSDEATDIDSLLGGSASEKVSGIAFSESENFVTLEITDDFSPGETLTIGQAGGDSLVLHEFSGSSSGSILAVVTDVSGFEITDPEALYIGAPALESVQDQAFMAGFSVEIVYPLYPLVLTEDEQVSTMREGNEIRLVLPEGLDVAWNGKDLESLDLRLIGPVQGVDPALDTLAVIHGDTAVVKILRTFDPGEQLAIASGLEVVVGGDLSQSPDSLRMSVTTSRRVHTRDRRSKWIGQPSMTLVDGSIAGALDTTRILFDQRGHSVEPGARRIRIEETGSTPSIRSGEQIHVELPDDMKGIVQWREARHLDAGLFEGGLSRGTPFETDTTEEGSWLRLTMDAELPPGRTLQFSLGLEGRDPVGPGGVDTLLKRLKKPAKGPLRLVLESRRDSFQVFSETVEVVHPETSHVVAQTEDTVAVYLPALFGDPKITSMSVDSDSVEVQFVTWPEIIGAGVAGGNFAIHRNNDHADSLWTDTTISTETDDIEVSLWGSTRMLKLVRLRLTPQEVRRLNRWFDDADDTAPVMTIKDESGFALPENDVESSQLAAISNLARHHSIRFELEDRYFRPADKSRVEVAISGAGEGASVSIDGETAGDIEVHAEKLVIPRTLDEGLHELWIFGQDSHGTLGLPTVRQFIIDTTAPVISDSLDSTPGKSDSVETPQIPMTDDGTINTLRPIPMQEPAVADRDHLLPVWNAETLRVSIIENVHVVPIATGSDTIALVSTDLGDRIVKAPQFFRMPKLPRPVSIELVAVNEEEVIDLTDIDATAFGARLASANSVDSVHSNVSGDTLTAEVGLTLTPEGVEFFLPLNILPEVMFQEGVVLAFRLLVKDLAGNIDSLGVNQDVLLRLASAEIQGVLIDKIMNFPNPFRTVGDADDDIGTTIRFVLTEDAERVKVRVFDVTGEQLYVADMSPKAAGEHLLTWTGRDIYGQPLATGVYFVLLEVTGASGSEQERTIMAVNNRN